VNGHYGVDLSRLFADDQGDLGGLTFDATVFYLDHDREGLNGNLVDSVGATGSERWRAQAGVGYSRGPWSLYWQTRYYAPSKIDPNDGAALFLYNDVASYTISDATIRYDLTNDAQVQLTVNNVFDKDPPFNSFSYQFDRLGRRYNLGFKYKF
jgi:outer membrane receptor protein involved in Fe transport